jgi:hypothetical protein
MMNIDFGPDWFWNLVLILAGIGALSGVIGFIWLVVWLCKHLRIV